MQNVTDRADISGHRKHFIGIKGYYGDFPEGRYFFENRVIHELSDCANNSATRISRAEFAKMYNNARKSKDSTELEQFYAAVFQNPSTICATFKKELAQNGARLENPDLKDELLNNVLEKIEQVNGTVQKAMLKSIGKNNNASKHITSST